MYKSISHQKCIKIKSERGVFLMSDADVEILRLSFIILGTKSSPLL